MASNLAEVQKTFGDDNAAFEKWLSTSVGYSADFASKVTELLKREYDSEAWIDATLADLEAHPENWGLA